MHIGSIEHSRGIRHTAASQVGQQGDRDSRASTSRPEAKGFVELDGGRTKKVRLLQLFF
jgi:hypothetical protein